MRVFIYEYICGGGFAGRPLPESLGREGWAMLASIVEDFARVEGCEVVTTLDERFVGRPLATRWVERIDGDSERRVIEQFAAECDWSLVIAPEFDGILLDRVRCVEVAGGRLLGPSSSAVAIASDKLACGQLLERSGVPAVVGQVLNLADGLSGDVGYPVVLKPRDGAGSQCTFLIRDAKAAPQVLQMAAAEGLCHEALLQPFVAGLAASASFLVGRAGVVPLLAGEQLLSDDGRFHYVGGRIPLPPEFTRRAMMLGSRAIAAMPGLRGFVGIDLVLGQNNLKSQISDFKSQISDIEFGDTVIEINSRLTTSYVGLRRLARTNLAEQMVKVAAGDEISLIDWQPGAISFTADGRVA